MTAAMCTWGQIPILTVVLAAGTTIAQTAAPARSAPTGQFLAIPDVDDDADTVEIPQSIAEAGNGQFSISGFLADPVRTRLNFDTSFSGLDALQTNLELPATPELFSSEASHQASWPVNGNRIIAGFGVTTPRGRQ